MCFGCVGLCLEVCLVVGVEGGFGCGCGRCLWLCFGRVWFGCSWGAVYLVVSKWGVFALLLDTSLEPRFNPNLAVGSVRSSPN